MSLVDPTGKSFPDHPHTSANDQRYDAIIVVANQNDVGWLCLTSHRQRGHLETAPPFTVPCEGREAR